MKEIMMAIGKMTEQEALMEMLDRDDRMAEEMTITWAEGLPPAGRQWL